MSDHDAAPDRAYLDHMPLSALDSMCCAVSALCRAGHDLAGIGFDVRFDLTGLNGATLSIDWRLPLTRTVWQAATPGVLFTNSHPTPAAADPVAEAEKAPAEGASGGGQEASDPAAAHEPEPTPEPEQTALAAEAEGAGDGGEGVAAPAPAVATEISVAAAIGAAIAEAAPLLPTAAVPPSPPPGSASALAAATIWTDAEDARLIQIVVGAMSSGATKAAAIRAVSEVLGRPEPGIGFRLRNKLAERLASALTEAAGVTQPAADPIPVTGPLLPGSRGQ